ncbi:hypothetical protein ACIGW4_05200 [Streptomyces sp. NPDC053513]|uniref:hypothetical protein n=1 Tax=unclassified Streptomyces TaxID=2593676 RepID=UPI0037D8B0BB
MTSSSARPSPHPGFPTSSRIKGRRSNRSGDGKGMVDSATTASSARNGARQAFDAPDGSLPVSSTRRVRLQNMKKIISAAALAAAGLGLAAPAAHAAPVPAPDTVAAAKDAVAGLTAGLSDPPRSQLEMVSNAFFALTEASRK